MTSEPDSGMVVTTRSGPVRGRVNDGVATFLGIPYAASPMGERRFKLPEPHATWADIRDATEPGPTAPQFTRPFPGLNIEPIIGPGWRKGDDFLTVNVWTPARIRDGAKRAVMVYIHGGAWVLGCSDTAVQDGSGFARSGVVCVSINYRLGVEGFLTLRGIPTNLGLRDQIAALRWVSENAEAFGGDRDNITVFGESAGAMSIADLVVSPLAKGLFRRAIIQSGHGAMVRPLEVGQRLGERMAELLDIPATLEGFLSRTPQACVEAIESVQAPTDPLDMRDAAGFDPSFGLSRFLPVYGDDVVPERPLEALAKGAGAEVEILIGSNREEMNLYWVPTGVKSALPAPMAAMLLGKAMPRADDCLNAYGLEGDSPAGEVFAQATHDLVFRWPVRRYAETHQGRAHVYELEWRSPSVGGELGACHGVELPFVFDTLSTCMGADGLVGEHPPQALADRVHRIWVDFGRDGSAPWPAYDCDTRQVFALEAGRADHEPPPPAAAYLS